MMQRNIRVPAFSSIDQVSTRIVAVDGSIARSLISRSTVSRFQGFVYQNQLGKKFSRKPKLLLHFFHASILAFMWIY